MSDEQKSQMGLTTQQVTERRALYGRNEIGSDKKPNFFIKTIKIFLEPMFLLLIIAATIYFILGEPRDGAIMLVFVVGIILIDVIQEWKTDKTLAALKNLSAPKVKVLRDGAETTVDSADLVPGDVMLLSEGDKIPADGFVLRQNDLCVDESTLTGESEGVWKCVHADDGESGGDYWKKDYCYAGTFVTQGSGYIEVDKIGEKTEYGKIGKNVSSVKSSPSPLKKQTDRLVLVCALIAAALFVLVALITYFNLPSEQSVRARVTAAVLSGITLAMAMIPEEFPVILTVFLSMGAWRLAKKKSLVRKLHSVETLGAVTVLCVDKTGTLTENRMTVTELYAVNDREELIRNMGLACETETYDPMEKAILQYCREHGLEREALFSGELVGEYAFTNALKMMGHVWQDADGIKIAIKGSPERVLPLCNLTDDEMEKYQKAAAEMSAKGLRVLAVAHGHVSGSSEIPTEITDCKVKPDGFIGLMDPPRATVASDIACCKKAGVRVIMITGDNGVTAASIAQKVGIDVSGGVVTGDALDAMTDEELAQKVRSVNVFSRVIPEHKMRIVQALKQCGEIVAMTGDGVNDAPALRLADIGIAMGARGSEVAREASDLILMDDNFSTIVDTIRDGRRIYDNIKKAVGYVFSIHIPIAFAALLAPLIGIIPSALLFLPLHVMLLELLIDPTCSIVLERQPAEDDVMNRSPRPVKEKLLSLGILVKSVTQGLVIFAASFGAYYFMLGRADASTARTIGLVILMLSNILLVIVNSSSHEFALRSIKKLMRDKVMWAVVILTLCLVVIVVYTPLNSLLNLASLTAAQFFSAVAIAAAATLWWEIAKAIGYVVRKKKNLPTAQVGTKNRTE